MNAARSNVWRRGAQYCGDRSGAAAVEFAIVGSVFIILLLSSFEAGLLLARITMVDHAVNEVAKDIYIGGVDRGVQRKQIWKALSANTWGFSCPIAKTMFRSS